MNLILLYLQTTTEEAMVLQPYSLRLTSAAATISAGVIAVYAHGTGREPARCRHQ